MSSGEVNLGPAVLGLLAYVFIILLWRRGGIPAWQGALLIPACVIVGYALLAASILIGRMIQGI